MRVLILADDRYGYEFCPKCGCRQFLNDWAQASWECSTCGTLGRVISPVGSEGVFFVPNDQQIKPFQFSILTKHEEVLL